SRDALFALGAVDASAAQGKPGEWLLDPKDVQIRNVATANGSFAGGSFTPDNTSNTPAIASVGTIQAALDGGTSVTISTTSTFAGNGDITVVDAVTRSAGDTDAVLTLNATRDIAINAPISRTGTGSGKL